jgi:uncharacterized protein YndB with AHSA1/START domain
MKTLKFQTEIEAPREAVWDAIVDDAKYRAWTSAFNEGSFFEGGWNEGDAIFFIGLNDKGEKEGMVAEIAKSRYPEYISIRHIGQFVGGRPDTTSEEVKKWAPAYENYTLTALDMARTRFLVELDTLESFEEMFSEMWPKALKKLKDVCEQA